MASILLSKIKNKKSPLSDSLSVLLGMFDWHSFPMHSSYERFTTKIFSDQRNSLNTQASYESIGPPPERSDRPLSMTTDDDVSWGSSEFDSYDSTEDEERRNSINSRKNGSRSDPARSPQIIAATVEYKVKGQQQPQV